MITFISNRHKPSGHLKFGTAKAKALILEFISDRYHHNVSRSALYSHDIMSIISNVADGEVEKKYKFGRTLGQGTFATGE